MNSDNSDNKNIDKKSTEIFSQRLNNALIIRNISAAELSRLLDVPESVISQYKKGLYKPKYSRLLKMSEALNVPLSWLNGDSELLSDNDLESKFEFANNLKFLRSQKKISQVQFANILNVSPSTVAMWENGERKPKDYNMLKRIADYFSVSIEYLITGYNSLDRFTTGEKIKHRRKELGISAEKLSEIISVSPATIYRYENNEIKKIPSDILVKIMKALSLSPEYLLGELNNINISSTEFEIINLYRNNNDFKTIIDILICKLK